jgi:hypothetical protein
MPLGSRAAARRRVDAGVVNTAFTGRVIIGRLRPTRHNSGAISLKAQISHWHPMSAIAQINRHPEATLHRSKLMPSTAPTLRHRCAKGGCVDANHYEGSRPWARFSTVGLDIAKSVVQVHGVDGGGAVVIRKHSTSRAGRRVLSPGMTLLARHNRALRLSFGESSSQVPRLPCHVRRCVLRESPGESYGPRTLSYWRHKLIPRYRVHLRAFRKVTRVGLPFAIVPILGVKRLLCDEVPIEPVNLLAQCLRRLRP